MHSNDTTQEIPYGYCQCGCGQKTKIAHQTDTKKGLIKGQPKRFVNGHTNRIRDNLPNPNPSGLCGCGCGQPTPIATTTRIPYGKIKGQPLQFIPGHMLRIPLEIRFWRYVQKTESCWLWTGYINQSGYGKMLIDNESKHRTNAHRASWIIHYGPIPDGLYVCHNCPGGDNPACVNPDHLWLGTHLENMQDCKNKGRTYTTDERRIKGEKHYKAKLTETQVQEILALRKQGITYVVLANQFGISYTHVKRIGRRESWKHI